MAESRLSSLLFVLVLVLDFAGRTLGRNPANEIAIDVSDKADSGSILYKFPHISGYRYLVSESPESDVFFLSNLESLTVSSRLVHLSNQTVSLSVCEEIDDETRVIPVQLRVQPSRKIPSLFGSVTENRPASTPVTFINGSLSKILSAYSATSNVTLTSRNDKHQRHKRRSDFELVRSDDGWELVTAFVLDYETRQRHELKISDAKTSEVVAKIDVEVDNVNDNFPVFNQTRYRFVLPQEVRRFSTVGRVFANDSDGDDVVFSFAKTYPCCVITPQTGDVIVVDVPTFTTELTVLAHEKDSRLR